MTSLSSLFEKRSKQKEKPNALGSLFQKKETQKFQNLAEDPEAEKPVHLPPQTKKEEPEDLESTIFVGNIPLTITRKHLKKFFQEYGKIVKVWFRSVPVEQNKMGTKANYVLKQYQEGADSMNAYVKFESKDSAEKACAANGTKVEEHTLRVSLCLDNNVDYDKTAFIGNLPLDIKQEELREHFESIGKIESVRVIKDKVTYKGIGIGYVRFADKQDMWNALKTMNGSELKGRPLRVKRAVEKEKLQKKFKNLVQKKMNKKGYTPPRQIKTGFKGKKKSTRKQRSRPLAGEESSDKSNARKFHFKRKMIQK